MRTCEGHLLCGVELDRVDCRQKDKNETYCNIKPSYCASGQMLIDTLFYHA